MLNDGLSSETWRKAGTVKSARPRTGDAPRVRSALQPVVRGVQDSQLRVDVQLAARKYFRHREKVQLRKVFGVGEGGEAPFRVLHASFPRDPEERWRHDEERAVFHRDVDFRRVAFQQDLPGFQERDKLGVVRDRVSCENYLRFLKVKKKKHQTSKKKLLVGSSLALYFLLKQQLKGKCSLSRLSLT